MSLIDSDSCECARSELELFEIPPTQTSIEESRFEEFNPQTSLDRNNPIEFKIITSSDEYLDLFQSYLYLKARILDGAGNALPDTRVDGNLDDKSLVYPINYFPASLFNRVECYLGSKPVGSSESLYPYRAYIETTLSASRDNKKTAMESRMFYPDADPMDVFDEELKATDRNRGAYKRFATTQFSKPFETISPIHNSLFQQQKLLLSKVPIYLKFHRNNIDFILMAKSLAQPYKIEIDKAALIVNIKRIASHVRIAHEERLLNTNAKYPLRKVDIKFFTRGANRADLSEPNLVTGVLPNRVIMGMVTTDAFNGHRNKNGFNFQDFGLSSLVLRKNGIALPFDRITYDFDNNEFVKGYFSLLNACGMWNTEFKNNGIDLDNYKKGYSLFGFNLSPDESLGDNLNLITEGHLSFDLRLKRGYNESITIICYLEYDSVMEITSNREIIYNE